MAAQPVSDSSGRARKALASHPSLAAAAAGWAVWEGTQSAWETGKKYWRSRLAYTVTVSEEDTLYPEVHRWLLTSLPVKKQRSLTASVGGYWERDSMVASPEGADGRPKRKPLRVTSSDRHEHLIRVEGHPVVVAVNRDESASTGKEKRRDPDRIAFTCLSRQGQEAVLRLLEGMTEKDERSAPSLWMMNAWGGWNRRNDLPLRPLGSVILRPGLSESLTADMQRFLDDEDDYTRLGIPWHRGYLFHGPPGTGKTSVAKGLASHFGLDIWYAPLGDLKEETSLMSMLADVRARSILLLEDIDKVAIAADEASDTPGQITASSLLNALDGVATPHGLITFITTNHFDRLGEALSRPGRMDVVEEFGLPGPAEVRRIYEHFYGMDIPPGFAASGSMSQAQVAEVFKRNMHDPLAAASDLSLAMRGADHAQARD